jgi:nitroimidazol reductase NimA-like FMN-containing flavoprotein (pyridoxamine 5'-phosphate oxidase superfamily)
MVDQQTKQLILAILADHYILTLATIREDGYPQATTVAYAHKGLKIYFMTGPSCQKVGNIQRCNKVSLTIDREYEDWHQIKGLSMGGIAEVLSNPDEINKAIACLEERFPKIHQWAASEEIHNAAFVKITPQVISVLNYEKGFGHTELVVVDPETVN